MKLLGIFLVMATLAVATVSCAEAAPQARTVEETFICNYDPLSPFQSYLIASPDCKRVAYKDVGANNSSISEPGNMFIVVDGNKQGEYGDVTDPVFSPDGKHVVYAATSVTVPWSIVLDGKRSSKYVVSTDPMHATSFETTGPTFTPDSENVVFTAFDSGKRFVVIGEDVASKEVLGRITSIVFSPDGEHMAYVVEQPAGWFVVADGVEGSFYRHADSPYRPEGNLVRRFKIMYSPDGEHLAYTAYDGENWFMVVDGVEGAKYDDIDNPVFGSGGELAYEASKDGKCIVVYNGEELGGYDDILEIALNLSDGALAYSAKDGGKSFVVRNGENGEEYVGRIEYLTWSPSGGKLAYAVNSGRKGLVVVDGVAGDEYEKILQKPIFSHDGGRMMYAAKDGGKYVAVIDGVRSEQYSYLQVLGFSPDGKHALYMVNADGKNSIMVDDMKGKGYDGLIFGPGDAPVFESANSFRYIGRVGEKVYSVLETIG